MATKDDLKEMERKYDLKEIANKLHDLKDMKGALLRS
jgi:hypothetical protein